MTIVADEGESFEFEATLFVSWDWTHVSFLWCSDFLKRIRFAINPSVNDSGFGGISEG